MKRYKVIVHKPTYNFDTHKYELDKAMSFGYTDYDSVQNMIGYMVEGNDDILFGIVTTEAEDE